MAHTLLLRKNTTASAVPTSGVFAAVNEILYNSADGIMYLKKEDNSVISFHPAEDGKFVLAADKGAANGVASLDGTGRIPASQLPTVAMEYKGAFDASTPSPNLANGTGTQGDFYRVSVAGSHDFGAGSVSLSVGDSVIYNGSTWDSYVDDTTLTASEIETLYEGLADTNKYTDADKAKVDYLTVTGAANLDTMQTDLAGKQDSLSDSTFIEISTIGDSSVTISSNDGASPSSDLLGTSGGSYGRIDINDTTNIRISPAIATGDTIRVTDGDGDVWEFEVGTINGGGLTQSYVQYYAATQPIVNPGVGQTTGTLNDFTDITNSDPSNYVIVKAGSSIGANLNTGTVSEGSASKVPTAADVKTYVDANAESSTGGDGIDVTGGVVSVDLSVAGVGEDQLILTGVSDSKFNQTYDIVKFGGSIQRAMFTKQSGFDYTLRGTLEAGSQITLSGMTATKFNTTYELIRFDTCAFTTSDNLTWNSTTSNTNPSFPMAYYNSANNYLLAYDTTNDEWRCFDLSDATGDTDLVLDMVSGERSSWTSISVVLSGAGQSESLGSGAHEDITGEIYDIPASSITQVSHTGSGDVPYAFYQYNGGQYIVAFNADDGRWYAVEPLTTVDYSSTDVVDDSTVRADGGSSDYESITVAGDTQYLTHPTDSSRIPNSADSNVAYGAGASTSYMEIVGGKLQAKTATIAANDSDALVSSAEAKAVTDTLAVSADLASGDNGKGASLIGVEDSAANFTATDLEGVLAELHGTANTGIAADTIVQSMMQDDSIGTNEIIDDSVTIDKVSAAVETSLGKADTALQDGDTLDGGTWSV